MPRPPSTLDNQKFINPAQIGGIESFTFADGEANGTRVLWLTTGSGLRVRVLPDRGLDIDHAFFNQHSLAFLTHKGATAPSRALDRGIDWLKGFPGGLLTSCGPFNIGPPGSDDAGEFGLHGTHSNTAASIESIIQPDPRAGRMTMSVTGTIRYGQFFGPCVELRRTISATLGESAIDVRDEFFNAGKSAAPHAWLLHINFGYPLLDEGAEFCYDGKVEPRGDDNSRKVFRRGKNFRRVGPPVHNDTTEAVAYLYPRAARDGAATVALVNRRLGLGVAIRYNTRQFPRCANWQHWGKHEYVGALEPMNGTVAGRDKDRARGLLDTLPAGARKRYDYRIEIITDRARLTHLRNLVPSPLEGEG
jgi:hypothetical protein